jgi:uncharacterized protein DUF6941
MAKVVLPRVHVMVLCNDIVPVPGEGNVYNLLGVRTEIQAQAFPYIHPRLCVYLQVTGHEGTVSGVVVAVNARTDEELFHGPLPPITLQGPLFVVSTHVRVRDCEFPEPGLYYFQVYFEQKLLGERPLRLTEGGGVGNGQERT